MLFLALSTEIWHLVENPISTRNLKVLSLWILSHGSRDRTILRFILPPPIWNSLKIRDHGRSAVRRGKVESGGIVINFDQNSTRYRPRMLESIINFVFWDLLMFNWIIRLGNQVFLWNWGYFYLLWNCNSSMIKFPLIFHFFYKNQFTV